MNPIILLAVFAITVIGAFIFGRATAAPIDSTTGAGGESEKTGKKTSAPVALDQKIKELETRLADAGKAAKRQEDEIKKLRDDAKEAKQKSHDRGERLEQARKDLEEERRRNKNLGSIESARKEMLAAKEEVERLKAELADRNDAPVAKVVAAPAPIEVPQNTIDAKTLEAQLDAKDSEARRALQEQAQSLKASFDAQVSAERDRYKGEIRSLQKRLRTALRDADKARRSAEANDRAYLILKSQLEGTLDRLAHHDPTLRRPDALDPPAPAAQPAQPAPGDSAASDETTA